VGSVVDRIPGSSSSLTIQAINVESGAMSFVYKKIDKGPPAPFDLWKIDNIATIAY
jgi:hypothetical protein